MGKINCPICESAAEDEGTRDYGERLRINCPRCGQFVITGTAVAMIKGRLSSNPLAVSKISHAVRVATSRTEQFEINSTEVDRLLSAPLPSAQRQLENLIHWIKEQARHDQLAPVPLVDGEILASIVGTSDANNARLLLRWARKEGLLELASGGTRVRLTPKAWKTGLEDLPKAEVSESKAPQFEVGHCPDCGPNRRADVVAHYEDRWNDDQLPIWTSDTYMVLKCRGCGAVFIKHTHLFSENEDYEMDPGTGEHRPVLRPKITYWPPPSRRHRPKWLEEIKDRTLQDLLDEVYLALDADQRVLAAIGMRTALDRAMVLLGAEERNNFVQKLDSLQHGGQISANEKGILLVLTDAGGAAAHRGWKPEFSELNTILDGTESFLHRTLILGAAVTAMHANVPGRPKRPRE